MPEGPISRSAFNASDPSCENDGTLFYRVNKNDIPVGFVSVPVTIDEDGQEVDVGGHETLSKASNSRVVRNWVPSKDRDGKNYNKEIDTMESETSVDEAWGDRYYPVYF